MLCVSCNGFATSLLPYAVVPSVSVVVSPIDVFCNLREAGDVVNYALLAVNFMSCI